MLKDLLEQKNKIFKLVCGAGNECADDVERYVEVYSKSGAQIFDICAKPEILMAAKRGLEKSGILKDRYICVSVGMKGDPHISKANIDSEKCSGCKGCERVCPNEAINDLKIIKTRCIGCGICQLKCPEKAIFMQESDIDLSVVIPELVSMGIDCIELHATSEFDEDIWEKWGVINKCFSGVLSICIDRLNLGNKQVLSRLKRMLKCRKPYTTIIQADGIPMSGSDDSYKTTLQAVAMSEIIQNEKLPVYIFISGGTNSKTAELAKMCGIDYSGIAIGSYARKIIKNCDFSESIKRAKDLIEKSIIC